jgi:hypothetical protein
MNKTVLVLLCGVCMPLSVFSQNLLMVGGEFNFFKPVYWDAGIGFNLNIAVFDIYLQSDTFLNFGALTAENADGEEERNFLVYLKDNLYYSWDVSFIGFRLGASAGFGFYSGEVGNCFFTIAGLAGIVILPASLVSFVIDIHPGYGMAFNLSSDHEYFVVLRDKGFVMPVSASVRLNLDRL